MEGSAMQNNGNGNATSAVSEESNLLREARELVRREEDFLSSTSTPLYVAASLGQAPYIVLADGAIPMEPRQKWVC